MAGHAPERIRLSVQEKSLIGIKGIGAASEVCLYPIHRLPLHHQFSACMVQIRILSTIPQMHIRKLQLCFPQIDISVRFGDICRFHRRKTVHSHAHGLGLPLDIGFYRHFRIGAVYSGRNLNSGCSEIIQVKMNLRYDNQLYVTVNAAVKGKIRFLGIDSIILPVIHKHLNPVFLPERFCHIHPESRIASFMPTQLCAVHGNLRYGVSAFKLQIHPVILRTFNLGKRLSIQADAAVIIISPILAVHSIPAMGQIDPFPFSFFYKLPVFI